MINAGKNVQYTANAINLAQLPRHVRPAYIGPMTKDHFLYLDLKGREVEFDTCSSSSSRTIHPDLLIRTLQRAGPSR